METINPLNSGLPSAERDQARTVKIT